MLDYLTSYEEYGFIVHRNDHFKTRMSDLKRIQIVTDYVLKNYQEKVSLEEAARFVSMPKSSLCKFLKRYAKKTFSDIVNEIRINKACDLIISTDKKLSTIGYECGYNDISYFSRTFKRIIHKNPRSFMLEHRTEQLHKESFLFIR